MNTNRRNFLTKSMLAAAGITAAFNTDLIAGESHRLSEHEKKKPQSKSHEPFSISIFSKHLHWLDYTGMAKLAAEIGFDGVDLTVRPDGHVVPENVERDLPKAMEAVSKTGKKIYMIATSINSAEDPLTEKILKTASSLGIKHYRTGWMYYNEAASVEENISRIKNSLAKLAELNEKYSISGEYQNHSGADARGIYFGGPIWDLAGILKSINSPLLGSQYDVYHANVEGANSWPVGLKLISPFIRTMDIKDFTWEKKDGKWISESVPLGEGIVDYKKYFRILKQNNISGPLSIHYEYPLGGANSGAKELSINRDIVIAAMVKDLETLRKYLADGNLD